MIRRVVPQPNRMAGCTTYVLLLIFALSTLAQLPLIPATAHDEAQALIRFKNTITQDPFGRLASWSHEHPNPCSRGSTLINQQHAAAPAWAGILCDSQQLHVVHVNLRSFNLSGSISSSLAQLPWLSVLDLSDNHFSGHLPSTLFDGLTGSLQYLNLSFNSLGGNLPDALGNLSALVQLDLSHNSLVGSVPPTMWQLPMLQLLWLETPGAYPLSASLPSALGFCPTIRDLRLRRLAMAGQIPPLLGKCKQLQFLVLHDNGLSGVIPQGIWQLPALNVLHLVETEYAAGLHMEPVPDMLGFCATITQLWLQGFRITKSTSRIRSSLGDCKHLEVLILDVGGDYPSGFVAPSIWQLPQLRVLTWMDSLTKNAIDSSYEGQNKPFKLRGDMPETFRFCSTLTHLQIAGIDLIGEIPPSLGGCTGLQYLEMSHGTLHGAIPTALQNLTRLQGLSFASNVITGGIPSWISHFSQLTGLDLGDNPLGGKIPPEIGQLKQLQILSLFTANLSGPVPEELGNCTQLEWLDLGSAPSYLNQVGSLPKSLARLANLKTLAWSGDIGNAEMFGVVLGNLTMLQYLSAPSASISGDIPPQLGNLVHLYWVDLELNALTGSIPPELANLSSSVQFLKLGVNELTGSIPPWLGHFSKLSHLSLGTNKLTGSIPDQFLVGLSNSSIGKLYLDTNELQGVLPSSIGGLKTVAFFYVSDNHLGGQIPVTLGNCTTLQDLSLANNNFEGQIPSTLGQLLALNGNLLLSNNSLTGEIPQELGNLAQLKGLDLSRNRLVGHIPKTLENCTTLQTVRLFENNLAGEVGNLDLSNMASIQTFTVQKNHLIGGLPGFINSQTLLLLDVGNNNLSGAIPTSTKERTIGLSKLRVLAMGSNRITGTIPDWVWDLPSLQLLDVSNNLLTGNMPHTLSHLQYLRNQSSTEINNSLTLYEEVPITLKSSPQVLTYLLSSRMLLDLSMNSFGGSISESFGELIGLTSLNLSHNHISGSIPPALSNLSHLESLDVSYNNLTGGIPEGLGTLSSLSSFDVSNNQLEGRIPTLNNFNTRFNISSFENNPGLCGFPLLMQCNVPNAGGNIGSSQTPTPSSEGSLLMKWIHDTAYVGGFFIGYPIGFVGGLGLLWLASKSRCVYMYRVHLRSLCTSIIITWLGGGLQSLLCCIEAN